MTKDEIKTLIAEKISGQGCMVDIGGGLPQILNGIVDLLAAVVDDSAKLLTYESGQAFINPITYDALVEQLGITDEMVQEMYNGHYRGLVLEDAGGFFPLTRVNIRATNDWDVHFTQISYYDVPDDEYLLKLRGYVIQRDDENRVRIQAVQFDG